MAESAACPGFQLGRPRYDQVSLVRPPLPCWHFKGVGAENKLHPPPCAPPEMLLLPRKVALIRALLVLLQIWTNFSLFTSGSALVWTFWCYASWHVVVYHQRCGTKIVTVMLDCKLHFNQKLLNMLFTLHFIALTITLNVFFVCLFKTIKQSEELSPRNEIRQILDFCFFLSKWNQSEFPFFFQKESGTCFAQEASCWLECDWDEWAAPAWLKPITQFHVPGNEFRAQPWQVTFTPAGMVH